MTAEMMIISIGLANRSLMLANLPAVLTDTSVRSRSQEEERLLIALRLKQVRHLAKFKVVD